MDKKAKRRGGYGFLTDGFSQTTPLCLISILHSAVMTHEYSQKCSDKHSQKYPFSYIKCVVVWHAHVVWDTHIVWHSICQRPDFLIYFTRTTDTIVSNWAVASLPPPLQLPPILHSTPPVRLHHESWSEGGGLQGPWWHRDRGLAKRRNDGEWMRSSCLLSNQLRTFSKSQHATQFLFIHIFVYIYISQLDTHISVVHIYVYMYIHVRTHCIYVCIYEITNLLYTYIYSSDREHVRADRSKTQKSETKIEKHVNVTKFRKIRRSEFSGHVYVWFLRNT